ncbi:Protein DETOXIFICATION 9, partial [Mucuna pruriens]
MRTRKLSCREMMGKEEVAPLLRKSEMAPLEDAFWVELKRVGSMAAPMVAATMSQYLVEVVSMMMVGHLGVLVSFSGVAIATSFAEVTGYCVALGMAGALETLCGQTYGAEEFTEIGNYTCCAIITLLLVCLPISLLWMFMDKILWLLGQDPEISHAAHEYCVGLIPALFGFAVLQCQIRYFQTQSMIFPMVFSSIAVLCLHVPICWCLVFKLGLGHVGGAYAIAVSYWLNVIGLGIYMKYSPACEKTKIVFSINALLSIPEFCKFAIPSGLIFEMWSFELLTLVAGLLPNPQLQTSVLSVCLNTTTLHYIIPYAVGASASTRISNELGAGNPKAAQGIVCVVVILGIADAVIVSTFLVCCRHILGYAYSNDKEVIDSVADIVPIICGSITADSLIGALSGIARGGGFQQIGAYVNLGAYYLVGVPLAFLLGFVLHFNAKGLWMGSLTGSILQVIILAVVTVLTDWQKEATKARERIMEKSINAHNGLLCLHLYVAASLYFNILEISSLHYFIPYGIGVAVKHGMLCSVITPFLKLKNMVTLSRQVVVGKMKQI